jgi:methyl-accepting chemotaxis protein
MKDEISVLSAIRKSIFRGDLEILIDQIGRFTEVITQSRVESNERLDRLAASTERQEHNIDRLVASAERQEHNIDRLAGTAERQEQNIACLATTVGRQAQIVETLISRL